MRRARSRSALRIERPAFSSSWTGRSAMRRAGCPRRRPHCGAGRCPCRRRTGGPPSRTGVGRRQPGLLERVHQLGPRLLLVDPAKELPDGVLLRKEFWLYRWFWWWFSLLLLERWWRLLVTPWRVAHYSGDRSRFRLWRVERVHCERQACYGIKTGLEKINVDIHRAVPNPCSIVVA